MEIVKIWREQPTNMRFSGERMNHREVNIYKFPGGAIPLDGESIEKVKDRLERKGFNDETVYKTLYYILETTGYYEPEEIREILADFYGIPAETAVSLAEVVESFHELVGSEIGE